MKYITIIFVLTLISFSAVSAETVEQRLVKLEQTVKAQSDSLAIFKVKVAEVELQRNFLSDIYNGNAAWLIGIVSILIVFLILFSGYTVYDNSRKANKIKKKLTKEISTTKSSIYKDIYTIHSDISVSRAIEYGKTKNYTLSSYLYLTAIKSKLSLAYYNKKISSDIADLILDNTSLFHSSYENALFSEPEILEMTLKDISKELSDIKKLYSHIKDKNEIVNKCILGIEDKILKKGK